LALTNGFTFNNTRKNYVMTIGKRRTYWAPITRKLTTVPNRPGAYLNGTDTGVRVIEVDVEISGTSAENLRKNADDFAAWMITEEPAELIFDDETDRVYFAVVEGTFSAEELVSHGYGTITFICPDPYKYGVEKTITFTNAGAVSVTGSVETAPVIKCNVTADTTYLAVSDGVRINLIGNPTKQSETSYEPESTILKHACNTLTGWTNSSSTSLEGVSQLGTLKTDGSVFYTDSYGNLVGQWHGPAMKTSLGSSVQDFRFDTGFVMQKTGANQAGAIEVALLNASNVIVAKVSLTKHFGSLDNLYARARVGTVESGHDIINENDAIFYGTVSGIFRVSRKGNVWTAQIFYSTGTTFKSKIVASWTDSANTWGAAVTQVQVRVLQRGDFPVVRQEVTDINIYKLNDPAANQVPIIARNGDVIEFDHANDSIRKNGIDFTEEKAFIGEYFALGPGANAIVVEPASAVNSTEVRWRDRWR
jgi:predicted phage tail component-like protein